MDDIKVGDIVNVVDWGNMYVSNVSWFEQNFDALDKDWIIRYAFGDDSKYSEFDDDTLDKTEYKVLFIGKHNLFNRTVALITKDDISSRVYLIDLDGLKIKTVPKKMTKAEIEKELGYEIDIVEEDN